MDANGTFSSAAIETRVDAHYKVATGNARCSSAVSLQPSVNQSEIFALVTVREGATVSC